MPFIMFHTSSIAHITMLHSNNMNLSEGSWEQWNLPVSSTRQQLSKATPLECSAVAGPGAMDLYDPLEETLLALLRCKIAPCCLRRQNPTITQRCTVKNNIANHLIDQFQKIDDDLHAFLVFANARWTTIASVWRTVSESLILLTPASVSVAESSL